MPPVSAGGGRRRARRRRPDAARLRHAGRISSSGPVGPTGGSVDRLVFGFTGDTRPGNCGGVYPQTIINNIFAGMPSRGRAVRRSTRAITCSTAATRRPLRRRADADVAIRRRRRAPRQDRVHDHGQPRVHGRIDDALCALGVLRRQPQLHRLHGRAAKPVSDKPYYRFDVQTVERQGGVPGRRRRRVGRDPEELAHAAAHRRRRQRQVHVRVQAPPRRQHRPPRVPADLRSRAPRTSTRCSSPATRTSTSASQRPRAIVVGFGGAPLAGSSFWGYGIVRQGTDDRITVTIYDQATGNAMDSFSVAPQ